MLERRKNRKHLLSGSLAAFFDYSSKMSLANLKAKIDKLYVESPTAWFEYHSGYEDDDYPSWILIGDELENEQMYQRRVAKYEATKEPRAIKAKAKRGAAKKIQDEKDLKEFIRLQKKFKKESEAYDLVDGCY